jgi:hypothetical protein
MSFKPVRTFLAARLTEVDPDFEVHEDAFSDDNIGDLDFDKRFHIFYGNVTTTVANQNTTQDTVNARVSLFFRGYRSGAEALDDAMDLANQYRINCLRVNKLTGQTFIKRVVCTNIEAQPLESNDNAIKIILSYSISVIFGTGINLDC